MVAVRQALSPPHHIAGHRKGFCAPRGSQPLNHSDCPSLGRNWPPKSPLKSAQISETWKRLQNSHPTSSHMNDSYKHKHTPVSSILPHTTFLPRHSPPTSITLVAKWAFSPWDECKSSLFSLTSPLPSCSNEGVGNRTPASFKACSSIALVRELSCVSTQNL